MKKILMLLVAMMLVVGFTGQAMAAFNQGDLIRVVYQDNGSTEYATDLGAFSATTPFTNTITFTDAFSTSTFGTTVDHLNVAYFVVNGNNTAWVAGPSTGQPTGSRQGTGYLSAGSSVLSYYASIAGTSSSFVGDKTNPLSFFVKMDKGTNGNGVMGGLIPGKTAEANLAALATTGYVDQTLYYYTGILTGSSAGVKLATIRTNSNGTTVINPSTVPNVPIPAAAYLFGSGLLSLIGIRRKMSA